MISPTVEINTKDMDMPPAKWTDSSISETDCSILTEKLEWFFKGAHLPIQGIKVTVHG